MKRFEKCLEYVQCKTNNGSDILECENTPYSESDYRYLEAKDLIKLEPAGNNEFYAVVTDAGITYFDDKKERKKEFVTQHLIKFVGGFASGVLVTIVAAWLKSKA